MSPLKTLRGANQFNYKVLGMNTWNLIIPYIDWQGNQTMKISLLNYMFLMILKYMSNFLSIV